MSWDINEFMTKLECDIDIAEAWQHNDFKMSDGSYRVLKASIDERMMLLVHLSM